MDTIPEQADIAAGLKRIRGRHRLLGAIFAVYIPAMVLLYLMGLPQSLILGAAVVLVGLGIVLAFAIGLTSCPSCGKPFHVRGMGGSIFTGSCMHCGIRVKGER
jgi:membrane associated rhomboid family serine protease